VHAFLSYVTAGQYEETRGGSAQLCLTSTVLFHPPGEVHADRFGEQGGAVLSVEFAPSWLARYCTGAVPHEPGAFRQGPPCALMARLHQELRCWDAVAPLAAEGLMLQLLAGVARAGAVAKEVGTPSWLRRVVDLLEARFTERFGLGELAEEAGVHPSHLLRVFRAQQGCSPGEFLRRRRVATACRRLSDTRDPMAAIALASGFADQSHFCRVFRRQMGITPAAYRAAARAR
jgi:AraC family transcriptional regulator